MEEWIQKRLSELLNFSVQDDFIQYIVQIEYEEDLESFFTTLLDNTNSKHKQFVTELKKKRGFYNNQAGYKKTNDNDNISKQNDKKKGKIKGKDNVQIHEITKPEAKSKKIEKKKTKFVSLLSHGNILLKGRHRCDCEAKRHALINNCLNCGKIVCAQENAGSCFFCGERVCSPKQQLLQSNTKQADNLHNRLIDQKPNKDLEDSLKQRDKLIEFDRNSARRTKVIDDESDYYQSGSIWLSAADREKLQKQETEMQAHKHMSRVNKKITIDFMGRIVDENHSNNSQLQEPNTTSYDDFENSNVCPMIKFDRPTFIEMEVSGTNRRIESHMWCTENRIQDKEYLEMSDQGLCLSMHQPYASLLVAGIKTHEGRSWYSSHRGRLWIASTAKAPSTEEISNVEHIYRELKNERIKFPVEYPISCLLGCVTVTDVLPRDDYRELYSEGEIDNSYVFICENAYMLPIYFPMKGKHKIYKMDKKLHQAVSKCLEKAMKMNDL